MSTPHTDRADDLAERQADAERRWEATLPPLPDRTEWFTHRCEECDTPLSYEGPYNIDWTLWLCDGCGWQLLVPLWT